jgi:hypothetical protein
MKRRKGYVNIDTDVSVDVYISDIIEELDDELLIDEIRERKLEKEFVNATVPIIDYRSICDLLFVNYHTPIPELIKALEQHLKLQL